MITDTSTPPPPPPVDYQPPPPPPSEEEAPPRQRSAGPFSRGSIRLSALVGTGFTSSDDYLILGAGLGYYVLDGLEVGVDYDIWFLADPVLNRISPGVRYVFHMVPAIKPYVGGFYRHTFVSGDGIPDFNYLGARLGIYYVPQSKGMYVGGGAVYEHMLDCNSKVWECDNWYPEIFIGVSF
jgi:hypothetical protein